MFKTMKERFVEEFEVIAENFDPQRMIFTQPFIYWVMNVLRTEFGGYWKNNFRRSKPTPSSRLAITEAVVFEEIGHEEE